MMRFSSLVPGRLVWMDEKLFTADLNSPETKQQLLHEIALSQEIGVHGFPGLVLDVDGSFHLIAVDYRDAARMLSRIDQILSES